MDGASESRHEAADKSDVTSATAASESSREQPDAQCTQHASERPIADEADTQREAHAPPPSQVGYDLSCVVGASF